MKCIMVLGCLLLSIQVFSQDYPHDYSDICCRADAEVQFVPSPAFEPISAPGGISNPCPSISIRDFANFSLNELIDYLIKERNPYNCYYFTLFGYNTEYTKHVFTDDNVKYIADSSIPLVSTFDGQNDNGLYSLISFLSLAVQHAQYKPSEIVYKSSTWASLRNMASILSSNSNVLLESDLSILVISQLMNIASSVHISSDPNVINLVSQLLVNLGNDSFENIDADINLYNYYFSYYYVLDLYLRYAPDNDDFIDAVAAEPSLLYSLGTVATNRNLNNDTYAYFGQLSSLSVQALSRLAKFPRLVNIVGPALEDVTQTFPEYSTNWVTASLTLVEYNVSDPNKAEEIVNNLRGLKFPNHYSFDDGKFLISTPMPYQAAYSLYQAAQEVKAQFFRLAGMDAAVDSDPNDTLRVKIYGTRGDYQDFNRILFGVNYPNSGGVYIETQGTFYTYDRTIDESPYSLEALFRHEYVHYLQGRYLVPGQWGNTPNYTNGRLVWFEEGMAQFLAGSTQYDGIKGLDIIKPQLERYAEDKLSLNDIFTATYSTGNPDAYYVFGPMLWFQWLENNVGVIQLLFQYVREENIDDFDNLISYYASERNFDTSFWSYIDAKLGDESFWQAPSTALLTDTQWTPIDIATLVNEISTVDASLLLDTAAVIVEEDPKRFQITGRIDLGSYDVDSQLYEELDARLNTLLNDLSKNANVNVFEYAVGYFTDVQIGETVTASFKIEGPLGEVITATLCEDVTGDHFQVNVFDTYAVFIPDPAYQDTHQFRYKDVSSQAWINLLTSSQESDTINYLYSPNGYEYAMRYRCDDDTWTDYSESKNFYLCPDSREIGEVTLDFNGVYMAEEVITTSSTISHETEVTFGAGESVTLLPGFKTEEGAGVNVKIDSCREPDGN